MAARYKILLTAGVSLAGLYFAISPRSPLGLALHQWASSWAGVVEGLAGLSATALVLAGYAGYLFSKYHRSYARYKFLQLAALLVWIGLAEIVWELHYSGRGMVEYLASLLLASPAGIILTSYIEAKFKPPRRLVVVATLRPPKLGSRNHQEGGGDE